MIDEKKLIDEIEEYIDEYSDVDENGYHNLKWCAMMEALDTITRQPKVGEWIPVSEGLPDENIGVQATIEMPHGKLCVFEAWLQNGRWIVPPRCREGKVVAWQPLPEPWEGE